MFVRFIDTMPLSDFPVACVSALRLVPSPTGPAADTADRFRDLPASVQGVCVHALVLRLRGSGTPLAISRRTVRPSHIRNWVGNPEATDFGAQ